MTAIKTTDILFATVKLRGKAVAQLTLSGMSSMADVVKFLRYKLQDMAGLVVLSLRNHTQGWLSEQALLLAAKPQPRGVQLSLF
ncbi:MAG: hypothetical protein LIO90_04160 [Bacteroidales bacterium]|nr:hypothetical protein [Bacteroidales bacterium]